MSALPDRKRRSTQPSDNLRFTLELLQRIPRHYVTAAILHEQLCASGHVRSLRTVQRQLQALSDWLPIEVDDRAEPYQFRWRSDAQAWRVPQLNPHESLLLTLAQQHLEPLLPPQAAHALSSHFSQAQKNLRDPARAARERAWTAKIRRIDTSHPLLPPPLQEGVLEAVSQALYDNRWLHITYRNSQNRESLAEVMPLGLVQQGPRLYIACRYRGYDNERSLALHRILRAEVSGLSFEPPTEFDLDVYIRAGRFSHGNGRHIRLSFTLSRDAGHHLLESRLSQDQEVEELEGGYRFTATVVDTTLLRRWLWGFDGDLQDVRIEPVTQDGSSH